MILSLLSVSLAGILALSIVSHFANQQEEEYLQKIGAAIAQESAQYFWPRPNYKKLTQLTNSASFFGNVRVRILYPNDQVITDSGLPKDSHEIAWFIVPGELNNILPVNPGEDWILGMFSGEFQVPPYMPVTIIRRITGPWGNHFEFETIHGQYDLLEKYEQESNDLPPRSNRVVQVPISRDSNLFGIVEISGGSDFVAEALETTQKAFLVAGVISILIAITLGMVMGNRLSKPILSLTEVSRQMSYGDLSVRASITKKDEIGQLASQFNQMAEQLQTSFDKMTTERDSLRRFVSDASHELRTPITALKNFNLLLQGSAQNDEKTRSEFLAESELQINRLTWITENLLDLSRFDAGLVKLEITSNDVCEIIEGVSGPYIRPAEEKSIKLIKVFPNNPVNLMCDRARIEIALSNLLDNAVKFAPLHGLVEIGARDKSQFLEFWVQDNGEGIPDSEVPQIFDRFYRGRNNTKEGSGLGLSIVKSIIDAHRGNINLIFPNDGGVRFTIELPKEES
jgi:signal transduction histidine kinase